MYRPLVKKEPILVRIRGIQCMNNNPSKAFVLHGIVEDNGIIQRIADEVVRYFISAGKYFDCFSTVENSYI